MDAVMVRPARIFRGWYVVGGAFAVMLAGFGSAYSFSAFVLPLQTTFHASRGSVSLVFSLAGFLYFGFGIVSGPLADRFGARPLAVLGMAVIAAGLAAASRASTLWGVYAAYGLGVGLGVGLSYVPVIGAVQRWFVRRRGLASGLAVSGIGVGTLLLPPAAAFLVGIAGWRTAYLVLGLFTLLVGGGFALLIEDAPQARGLAPDGLRVPAATTAAISGATVRAAIRTRHFAGLYAGGLIASFGVFVPFVHLVPYATDHDIAPTRATLLLGAIGVGSTAGRFVLGGLADRFGRLPSLLAMFVGMAAALAAWPWLSGFWSLGVFALAFGVFYGGWVALMPALVMDWFGGRSVAGIIGVLYTGPAFGTLLGPSGAGYLFDLSHSYTLAALLGAGANLVAAATVAVAARSAEVRH